MRKRRKTIVKSGTEGNMKKKREEVLEGIPVYQR